MMNCQQGQLYGAEDAVPRGRVFQRVEEMQEYASRVIMHFPRMKDDFKNVERIEVWWRDPSKGSVGWFDKAERAGGCDMGHRDELSILHEIAHVLVSARWGANGHGPWFARTYLELVYHAMGSDAYVSLWSAFKQSGIDCEIDDAGIANVVRL